jgi:hypothetical protein
MTLPVHVRRERETYGELGEAMRALPNEKWRDFVRYYLTGDVLRGGSEAFRKAGFGGSPDTLSDAKRAYILLHDDRIQRAIAEESRKHYRAAIPAAVEVVKQILANPDHKDQARVAQALLDRVDPIITRHDMNVVHKVTLSADEEMLEELKAARALGVSREKLVELFGGNMLPRLEQLEARANAKVIEGRVLDPIEELIGPAEEPGTSLPDDERATESTSVEPEPVENSSLSNILAMEDGSF